MEMQKYLPVKQKENIPIKHKGNDAIRTWTCEGKSALNVAEYLYKGTNVYLDRKYEKYLEFVELYKTKKRHYQLVPFFISDMSFRHLVNKFSHSF